MHTHKFCEAGVPIFS